TDLSKINATRAMGPATQPALGQSSGTIGTSSGYVGKAQPITAYYFPGETAERALVIGGVHGSELAGIEVAQRVVDDLKSGKLPKPYYTVIVVPELYPESAALARTDPSTKTSDHSIGREIAVPYTDPKKAQKAEAAWDKKQDEKVKKNPK